MVIDKLNIRNFKGLTRVEIDFDGKNCSIFGDNGVGKTRINDAYSWLISGRNSSNAAKFGIKPWDESGNTINGVECEVEGIFRNPEIKFRKVYREVWKKVEGSANEIYDGNTVDHYVDDVPVSQKKYLEKINEIFGSVEIFMMLANPGNFASNKFISGDKRREIIFEVCGDLTDDEIFELNSELTDLKTAMGKKKMDDYRDIVEAALKKLNKEIETIPTRISENQRIIEETNAQDLGTLTAILEKLTNCLKAEQQKLLQIENSGNKVNIKNEIATTEAHMLTIKTKLETMYAEMKRKAHTVCDELTKAQNINDSDILTVKKTIKNYELLIEQSMNDKANLKEQFIKISGTSQDDFMIDDKCSYCKQTVPTEQLTAIHKKVIEEWNLEKAKQLEKINNEGKNIVQSINEFQHNKNNNESLLMQLELESGCINKNQIQVSENLKNIEFEISEVFKDQAEIKDVEWVFLKQNLIKLKSQLEQPEEAINEKAIAEIKEIIIVLEQEIKKTNEDIATAQSTTKATERIKELAESNILLGQEHAKLSRMIFLIEMFIRTKVEGVATKINEKFKLVKWKLFETLENGKLKECCECMINGVPWNADLNTGAKTNAGIDIINTLQKHFNIEIPIFADNMESVTKIIETNAQIIKLIVLEEEKEIKVTKGE
jgi:chromosome segregation ATPase